MKNVELYEGIDVINNLDEAMLFILISKYETLKEINSKKQIHGIYEIDTKVTLNRINATLKALYEACKKFNINSKEEINEWSNNWKKYLASLSDDEYRLFIESCISGHNINSFRPDKNEKNQENQKVIRIS